VAVKKKKKVAPAKTKVKVSKPKNGVQYTQSEFFQVMQESCDLESKKQAKEVYESFANMIQVALKKGYKLPLPGIGKMQVRKTKARMGRNPATGEAIRISAKKRVRLTPSKALKDAVL
jgi:DNA-binding protein HU-beta